MSPLVSIDGPPALFAVLLPAAALVPLFAAGAVALPAWRSRLPTVAVACALPALLVALVAPIGTESRLPWVLLDLRLRLDETGLVFLRFTSLVWLAATVYARGHLRSDPAAPRFSAFWLAAMGGNYGLLLAADLVTFYLFFAALGLACYGLVLHGGDAAARRASRIYLVFVLVGDGLLFGALVLLARTTGGLAIPLSAPAGPLATALLLAGLGIKLGAWPLHAWLPIAHPVAPIPASAVLSGVVIKSGLFGWLRFLPLGQLALPAWSDPVVVLGLVGVFFAAAAGTLQRDPKTALAYSSVSQVGLMTVAIGTGLAGPEAWPAARVALLVYAVHHGVTKGALFLGVGVAAGARGRGRRIVALGALGVAAASLAGAPFTSGEGAKALLKTAVEGGGGGTESWLPAALSLGAAATAVLMGRVLWLAALSGRTGEVRGRPKRAPDAPSPLSWAAWLGLVAAMLVASVWLFPETASAELAGHADLWSALWPALLGTAIAGLLWHTVWRREDVRGSHEEAGARAPAVPPGDFLVPVAGWA
ncbi:MAG: complex I subunit 5 family protein, partial [Gemmatimonadota bacterium]|nr:complex I subunit 5 family protein [Gemmatimonadota bacterium]